MIGHVSSLAAAGSAMRKLPLLILHEGVGGTGSERPILDRSVASLVARPTGLCGASERVAEGVHPNEPRYPAKDMGKDQPWGEGPAIPMHLIGTRDG